MKNLWSLFLKEKIGIHISVWVTSGICSITLANILFALALQSKYFKAGAFLIGFLLTYGLFYFLYFRFVRAVLPDIATHWLRNTLVALAITGFVLSLTPQNIPYHPVEHTIQISTDSPYLGFIQIVRHIKTGPPQLVEDVDFRFSGDWELINGVNVHLDDQPAEIDYRRIEFVRESMAYHFTFLRQDQPTSAVITIDDESHLVVIEPEGQQSRTALFKFEAPDQPSTSHFWQVWITIFPYISALTLFIVVFSMVSFILYPQRKLYEYGLNLLFFSGLIYLFWMTLNYQNDLYNHWTFHMGIPLLALLCFVLVPMGLSTVLKRNANSKIIVLLLILAVGVGVRVYWILMVPSAQVSDFGRFHQWALQLASGEPGLTIDRYASFTRMLSLVYRVFPSHQAIEVLNVLYSFGTMLCLYWIGKVNQQEEAGLMAAYLFAVFPAQISMVSIVNTDIPGVFLLTASIYSLICFIQRERWRCLVFSAVGMGLAYLIRGALLIYLPVLIVLLIVNRHHNWKVNFIRAGAMLAGFVATVVLVTAGLSLIKVEGLVLDEGRNMIWPLVNGTNIEELGRNNPLDEALVFSWPVEEATQNGIRVVMERVFSDPIAYYKFLKVKYEFMFADATYGANLAFFDETHEYFNFKTGWKYPIGDVREGFAQLSQYAYLAVLLAAVLASLKIDETLRQMTLPVLMVLVCAFGAYAFFEVQPRYARPIIPFVILMAGLFFFNQQKAPAPEPNQ